MTTEADPRWAQILRRDPAAEGRFLYSVRSTGVFCRPGCKARRPNPANVAFHADAAAARAAGFRPCKRCQPEGPSRAADEAALIAGLCARIEAADVPPTLAELAAAAGLSPHWLQRRFKAVTGLSPKQWGDAARARRLRDSLQGAETVTDALYQAGFNASSRFYAQADAMLGMTPGRYRKGGQGEEIRHAFGDSSLGLVLVAAGPRGICAITLGDERAVLLADLAARFPKASHLPADPGFDALVAQVVSLVDHPGQPVDLPLDIQGTAFQMRVWQALRAIPAGEVRSYADLARAIGAPAAVRAVAGACAANKLAVAIPCHRILRQGGAISGYRWGVARKRALLAREGVETADGSGV